MKLGRFFESEMSMLGLCLGGLSSFVLSFLAPLALFKLVLFSCYRESLAKLKEGLGGWWVCVENVLVG